MPAPNDIRERAGQIRDLVAGDQMPDATKRLLDLATDFASSDSRNRAIVISSERSKLEKDERSGLIDLEKARTTRAGIMYRLLALVDAIEETPKLRPDDVPVAPGPDPAMQYVSSPAGEVAGAPQEQGSGECAQEEASALEASFSEKDMAAMPRLADFADRFAVKRELFHDTLLLWQQLRSSDRESEVDEIAGRAKRLVREIVHGFRSSLEAGKLEYRRARVDDAYHRARRVEPPREVVLVCSGLGKRYRRSGFHLRRVDLEIRLGKITGVVGRNANGKTTLLRVLAGELRHDEGSLAYPALNGHKAKKIKWARVKNGIAYLPQELPSWDGSLQNNLHFEAALHGIRGKANEREVAYIVERLELGGEIDKRWKELSGGTRLRFALARALVWKPKLLVLDEPLANLDFTAQHVLLKDLLDLVGSLRHPMAVVISSQHLHEVEAISEHIVFLREGDVVYNGPRSGVGGDRKENVFEIGIDCSSAELQALFSTEAILRVRHNGICFVVHTAPELCAGDLLRKLIAEEMRVEYFRDVSRSTKLLFESQ